MRIIFFAVTIACFFSCSVDSNTNKENAKIAIANSMKNSNTPENKADVNVPEVDSTITLNYLMGKFSISTHPDFSRLKSIHASSNDMYLRKEAYEAFEKMYDAAKKDGIKLTIKSATRSFDRQKTIWEGKWNGQRKVDGQDLSKTIPDPNERAIKILQYSSMPGSSRHHWGTDMDINAFVNSYFESGKGLKEYEWMVANAASFGFCQPYTEKGTQRPNGYNEEKWHWSYLPIAQKLTEQYKLRISNEDISGFDGANSSVFIQIVENYVLGINKDCF